jgi:hypothetical protein
MINGAYTVVCSREAEVKFAYISLGTANRKDES